MQSENNKNKTRATEKMAITSKTNQAQAEKAKTNIEAESEIIEAEIEEAQKLLAVNVEYEKKIGARNIEESKQFSNKLLEITGNQEEHPTEESYKEVASEKEIKKIGFNATNNNTLSAAQMNLLVKRLVDKEEEINNTLKELREEIRQNKQPQLEELQSIEANKESCIVHGESLKTYKQLITELYKNGEVKPKQKLTPRNEVINPKVRRQDESLRAVYKILQENNTIRRDIAKGYYAVGTMNEALSIVGGAK